MKGLLFLFSLWFLSACAPLLIGGAAGTGVAIYDDRRTTGTIIDDRTLQLSLLGKLGNVAHISENSHINVSVFNGVVLLSGEVANQAIREEAGAFVANEQGVRLVHNYLIIGPRSSLMNRSYDTMQTAKVKTAMLDVKVAGFNPNRVRVVTEHGVCYLMGLVTEQEAAAITDVARRVSGVQGVVTLFEIDNEIAIREAQSRSASSDASASGSYQMPTQFN